MEAGPDGPKANVDANVIATALGRQPSKWRQYGAMGSMLLVLSVAAWQIHAQIPPRSAVASSLHSGNEGTRIGAKGSFEGAFEGTGYDEDGEAYDPAMEFFEGDIFGDGAWVGDLSATDTAPTLEDILESEGQTIEERLPMLKDWVFPVLDSDEGFPLKPSRQFGAFREGKRRPECDRGHCGVDLSGPRGAPVVAVAYGTVVRIERRSNRRSGKYVRLQHQEDVYTAYMHLDDIAEGLRVGDEVEAGDVLGTLGRTGILHSAPHLHFGLEIPRPGRIYYLDPLPYLKTAERLSAE